MIWKIEEDGCGDFVFKPRTVRNEDYLGYLYTHDEKTWKPSICALENVPKHIIDRFINQLERGYDK